VATPCFCSTSDLAPPSASRRAGLDLVETLVGQGGQRKLSVIVRHATRSIVRQFSDRMTGTTLERPGLQRMLDESRHSRFDLAGPCPQPGGGGPRG
jgi:hypothetical protein